jgi:tRNA nucleotidyltransferase (CCA-adding enzyme)
MSVQLYEVGGSIRDEFLGLENKDRDFVAVCPSGWDSLVEWAEGELDKLFLVTPEYFTIRGIKGKEVFDIVLARKEGAYSDGRHPDEVEPGTLEDDLARRDFTMNAIARSMEGELIDPFGGKDDIEEGIIQCVGDAEDRFKEDGLRVLRALRFMVTKPTMVLDASIQNILRSNRLGNEVRAVSRLLDSVSRERIREELYKMFKHDTITAARVLFDERIVHSYLNEAIFMDSRADGTDNDSGDIWLKPSMGRK